MRPYHNIVNPVSESSNNAFCTADQSQSVVAASRGPMDDTAGNNSAVNNRVKPLPGTIAHDLSIDMLPLSGGCPTREFFHKRSALPHLNAFGSKTGFVNSIFLLEGRRA